MSGETRILGKEVEITDHSSSTYVGKKGTVTKETKNTFTVDNSKIPKKYAVIRLKKSGNTVKACNILTRPVER
jgi:RNase P/RNase MRP subunit p29